MQKKNTIISIVILVSLTHQRWLVVFHWSLSDNKSTQVSRTILSILSNLDNAIVWVVLSQSSLITLIFNSLLRSLARFKNFSFFSFSLIFFLWSAETAKPTIRHVLFFLFFFLLIITRWSVCISKSQKMLRVSFSWMNSGLYKYHLDVWANFSF